MKEVTRKKIIEIVNLCIEDNKITIEQCDEELSDLGVDSIKFINIVIILEEEFECEIPDSKLVLSEMGTVNKIYDLIISIKRTVE